MAHAINLANL